MTDVLSENDAGLVVSCAKNPLDARPVIEAVAKKAQELHETTGKPVVVLFGEEHKTPFKILLPGMAAAHFLDNGIAVGKPCNDNSKPLLAMGMEYEHDTLETILKTDPEWNISSEEAAQISERDPDGHLLLMSYLSNFVPSSAPVAHHTLVKILLERNISTRFTDLPFTPYFNDKGEERVKLDLKKPWTQAIAQSAPDKIIDAESPDGMALRNIAMVKKAADHIEKTGATYYFQIAGIFHVFGHRESNDRYQDSLSAKFSEADFAVLPIFNTVKTRHGKDVTLDSIPLDARAMLAQAIVTTNTDPKRYKHIKPSPISWLFSFLNEKSRCAAIMKQSGQNNDTFDSYDWAANKKAERDFYKTQGIFVDALRADKPSLIPNTNRAACADGDKLAAPARL